MVNDLPANQISNFLPPQYRDALVAAARRKDIDTIDNITDQLAAQYPELVANRREQRLKFTSRRSLR